MNRVEVVVVIAIVALLGFAIYSEVSLHNYAAEHHCKKTGDTREQTTIQYTYDDKGNIAGSYPVFTTEYLYACDDGTRHWH